ncbi:hypothetical protein ABZ621_13625 [Streptomyces sp. NPDC007863]|uniref:hypothetical protein n=1 Tax=Streptomyces sp. NPDC007863 TaxID=3154894 RepID=UPI0033C12562
MLRTRIGTTVAVAVAALGAALAVTAGTTVPSSGGLVVAAAPAADTVPVAGTDNMTWQ